MSLLIKALASAEKDKQAAAHTVGDIAPLTLEPMSGEQTAEVNRMGKYAKNTVLSLSLEEEAGIALTPITRPKEEALKHAVDKDVAKEVEKYSLHTDSLKSDSHETPATEKPAHNAPEPLVTAPATQKPADKMAEAQKTAAKAFVANQDYKTPTSKYALAGLGLAGALLVFLGLQGYSYWQNQSKLEVAPIAHVIQPPVPLEQPQIMAAEDVAAARQTPTEQAILPQNTQVAVVEASLPTTPPVPTEDSSDSLVKKAKADSVLVASEVKAKILDKQVEAPNKLRDKQPTQNNHKTFANKPAIAPTPIQNSTNNPVKHSPLKLVSKMPSASVDPTLFSAYQAFNHGEYVAAQQQYRQVLQNDIHNVDALLGMAAIAQRQDRDADAAGWYQKVLAIDPRNDIAQAATISTQANGDAVSKETSLKNMLSLQPEAANLHAALGNVYAEQNQWPSAQEAYFNASRFAPNNADYVFNMAISLDQMGKFNLALRQYQRALDLLNKSGATSPDRAQLEARIQVLQSSNLPK